MQFLSGDLQKGNQKTVQDVASDQGLLYLH